MLFQWRISKTQEFLKFLLAGECLIIGHFSPDFRQILVRLSDLGATNQSSKESIHFFRIVDPILAVKARKDGVHPITFDIIQWPIWRRRHVQTLHPSTQSGESSGYPLLLDRIGDAFHSSPFD
jgi:hypothetical protein